MQGHIIRGEYLLCQIYYYKDSRPFKLDSEFRAGFERPIAPIIATEVILSI